MNRSTDLARRRALAAGGAAAAIAGALLAIAAPARAAGRRPEPFDAATWTRLRAELPRPALVVFTTTYCSTCPAVIDALRAERRARRPGAPLVAVVLDGDALERGARAARLAHLGAADRLFAYRGEEAPLRFHVDPAWRGVTPYVALLGADGTTAFVAGRPDAARLDAWSGRAPR